MGISATRNGTNDRGSSPTLLFALIAACLAGNYFNYPLFLTIDFLFGSIFALLALTLCRLGGGAMAGMVLNKNPRSPIGREETP